MIPAVVTPAVEALPGNYDFIAWVPLMLSCLVAPWMFLEFGARWLRRSTDDDDTEAHD